MANQNNGNGKSIEQWLWDTACSIRGAEDAAKDKDYILPLAWISHLENRIEREVAGQRCGE